MRTELRKYLAIKLLGYAFTMLPKCRFKDRLALFLKEEIEDF